MTSARVGPPGSQDELATDVDLGRGDGAVGFLGKASEVSWIQRCWEILFLQSASEASISYRDLDLHLCQVQDVDYHADDTELQSVDEDHVDPLK
jgi:hypothetical protein